MLDDLFPDRKKRQNENKETLKNIIIENLKRQRLVNRILDKISSQGIESLDRYERETLDNENNPNFDEKSSLISKIKYIVEKYGNIFLKGLTNYELPIYMRDGDEVHFVNELSDDFVKIIVIGGPNGNREIADYPVNYNELELKTLKSIDDVINDYEYGE
jgi:cystathionine beta-lyase family protein involved in aluminum resistance